MHFNCFSSQRGRALMRSLVAGMSLSAAGLVSLVMYEGYTSRAVVPVKADVPTIGFGSTVHEDGSPVKLGDITTPQNALKKTLAHISRDEQAFRDSLSGAFLTQPEYDLYLDFVYNFGLSNWRKSEMRKQILQGEHRAACDALLAWRYQGRSPNRRDCSLPTSWGPKGCKGVWLRQQERHAKCLAAVDAASTPPATPDEPGVTR